MMITPHERRLTVSDITKYVENYTNTHKGERVVVFVDYLQYLASENPKATENSDKATIDASLAGLKGLASRLDTPIVALSSMNRQNYGAVNQQVAKGSGEIEYTADTLLCISSANPDDSKLRDIEDVTKGDPTRIKNMLNISVVKNRSYYSNVCTTMDFYTAYSYFEEKKKK